MQKEMTELKKEIVNLKAEIKTLKEENKEIAKKIENQLDSKILINNEDIIMVNNWIRQNAKLRFELLYRVSRDGDRISTFTEKVRGKSPTLILIKSKSGYKFGGYTSVEWDMKGSYTYKEDKFAFIFSINNKKKYDIKNGNERCALANEMLCQSVADYIAVYNNKLGGADVIVFTAGIGENSIDTRKRVIELVNSLGVKIDEEKNNVRGKTTKISTDDSKIEVYIIPTNEELMIAQDTYELINK